MLRVVEYFAKSFKVAGNRFRQIIQKFLLAFESHCSCCYIVEISVKNCDFLIPPAFHTRVRGYLSEYCHKVWYRQTRMVWIVDCEKRLVICVAVSTQYRRVTDGQTSCDSIVRAMHTLSAAKMVRKYCRTDCILSPPRFKNCGGDRPPRPAVPMPASCGNKTT